jgi:hypothetical protein
MRSAQRHQAVRAKVAVCQTKAVAVPYEQAPGVATSGRLSGRWRYDRTAGRGVALSYERGLSRSPVSAAGPSRPVGPAPTHSPVVRVLCNCGGFFAFDGDGGVCPGCGRPAEWPTMGVLEREMRADLEALLRDHEDGAGRD